MSKKTEKKEVGKVAAMLLEGLALDKKKGEIYAEVFNYVTLFKFSLEKDEAGIWQWKWTFEKEFKEAGGITGIISKEFPYWPADKEKKPLSFSAVRDLKKAGKLSSEQVTAYDATNNFSNWCNGYRLTLLNEKKDVTFQSAVEAKYAEKVAALPKDAKKNTEVLEKTMKAAKEEVRRAVKPAANPRLLDAKSHTFKESALKQLSEIDKTKVVMGIVKADPSTVIEALKASGRPVIEAKSVEEMHASFYVSQLEKHLTTGEFTNPMKARKAIEELKALLAVNGVKELSKGKEKKKVANA